MKFETKIAKLGITEEVEKILNECELYNPATDKVYLQELSKMKNWEIQEHIDNYFDCIDKDGNEVEHDNYFYCNLNRLCETYGFSRNRLSEWYARAIAESGCCLAYEVNEDVVLVIEDESLW